MATESERLRHAGEAAESPSPGGGSFARNVSALLERVEYRRCDSGEDAEDICRLRYRAYRANGFVGETGDQRTSDELDSLPNCYRFGMYVDGQLVSTVRVHHQTAEMPDAPVMKVFGDVLLPRLARGESFINPSLLAADPEMLKLHRALPYLTLRLAVIANAHFKTTNCVCMVREEHTAFYSRIFGSAQVGFPRRYPPFSVPVMLYDSECEQNLAPTVARFPFFKSTPAEQRLLFHRGGEEPAPLVVLPTAKYRHAA